MAALVPCPFGRAGYWIRSSSLTAASSSSSSLTVAPMRSRENSLSSSPRTTVYVPALVVHRKTADQPVGHSVGPVGRDRHRHPIAGRRAGHPVIHVVDRRVCGRGRARRAADLDDLSASLLHARDELVLEPLLVIDHLGGVAAVHLRVEDVRILGGRVVAPDRHVRDLAHRCPGLRRQLADRSVVVQAGHRGEALRWDVRRVALGDQHSWCWRGCRRPAPSRREPRDRSALGPGA